MNPFLRSVLEGGNASYQGMQANGGHQTTSNYLNQGLNQAVGKGLGAGYLTGVTTLPIVKNNLQYAEPWMSGMQTLGKVADAQNRYSGYTTALGMLDPETGSGSFSNAMGLGNVTQSGFNYAMGLNPISGALSVANSLTANEKNPHGSLPIVSDIAEYVGGVAQDMQDSPIGQGVSNLTGKLYKNTLGHLLDNPVGRGLHQTASIPMAGIEGLFGLVKEGYQALDRNLFNNHLPGGGDIELPETQQFDNPFKRAIEAVTTLPDAFRTKEQIGLDDYYENIKGNNSMPVDIGVVDKLIEGGMDRYQAIDSVLKHNDRTPDYISDLLNQVEMSPTEQEFNYYALDGRGISDLDPVILGDDGMPFDANTGEPIIKTGGDMPDMDSLLPKSNIELTAEDQEALNNMDGVGEVQSIDQILAELDANQASASDKALADAKAEALSVANTEAEKQAIKESTDTQAVRNIALEAQLARTQTSINNAFNSNYINNALDRTFQSSYNITIPKIERFERYDLPKNPQYGSFSYDRNPMCWVAREVYGQDNPKWMQFRKWVIFYSPRWFYRAYLKHGEKIAQFLKGKDLLKKPIRKFMDAKIEQMESMQEEAIRNGV